MQTCIGLVQEKFKTHSNNLAADVGLAHADYAYTYDAIPVGTMVGNMTSRSEGANTVNYTYGDSNHVHAVILITVFFTGTDLTGGSTFTYDTNGNMTARNFEGDTYTQKFDVENRLVAITHVLASSAIADTQTLSVTQFVYDGDGNRVKTIYPDSSWTAYIGDHYEVDSDGKTRSYYFLGAQRIAMRIDYDETDVLYFFNTDHLGSTSLLSDEGGYYVAGTEARYLPYGEYRIEPTAGLTNVGYTGHRMQDGVGLIYIWAHHYFPYLNLASL